MTVGRECGECSMCCKLLPIEDPELKKAAGKWCQHCHPKRGGCTIYETRPAVCRSFACVWLTTPQMGDAWWPAKSKIVVVGADENDPTDNITYIVDPAFPTRWRAAPYYAEIKKRAIGGLNTENRFLTYVEVGSRRTLVLPRKEVDITGRKHDVEGSGLDWEVSFR